MILWLLACTNTKNYDPSNDIGNVVVATVSMDYGTGILASADLDQEIVFDEIASISGDPIVKVTENWIWQINRYQYDTLRKYSLSNLNTPIQEISIAPEVGSANPHDLVTCHNQVFVTQYELDELLVLDVDTLEVLNHISLSEWSDADGVPEASSLLRINDSIFIGLQRLNRNAQFASEGSIVLELDCLSHEIINHWNIGNNIQILSWQNQENIRPVVLSQAWNDQPSSLYELQQDTWQTLWSSESDIASASILEGQLLLTHLSDDLSHYELSCIDLNSQNITTSAAWIEYLPDIQIRNDREAWVAAHWGWSDISNARTGLHRIDLQTCTSNLQLEFALAPVSFDFLDTVEN